MTEEHGPVSVRIKFKELCDVMDDIKKQTKNLKRRSFDRFLRKWKETPIRQNPDGTVGFDTNDFFYPALRLMTPSVDNRSFAMGKFKLGHLVDKVLVTKVAKQFQSMPNDLFVAKVTEEVVSRQSTDAGAVLSVAEVNDTLDRIRDTEQKEDALRHLFKHCDEREIYWILHVLLDDVENALGIPHSSVLLKWFNPKADEMLKMGYTLEQVCLQLQDEGEEGSSIDLSSLILCKPFRPMLLKRLNWDKYCLPKIIKVCHRPFYVEFKYDGEHFLLHKYCNTQYKYYTRKSVDYTEQFGPDSETKFSAKIHPFFRDDIVDCILDCEALVWDKKTNLFAGKNRRASDGVIYDVKHVNEDWNDDARFERTMAVFDLLYLNGKSLLHLPLDERLDLLNKRVFTKQDKGVIFISKKELMSSAKQFIDYYNKAMRSGEEGIVVKARNSLYKMGSRAERNGWFKIKPDYGIQSVMDLAVVAIRYDKANNVEAILVAAAEGEKENLRFAIVAGITTGMKKLDFRRLMEILDTENGLFRPQEQPTWISSRLDLSTNLKVVKRENIVVVEVRASGIINRRLQFPSIVSIRTDKAVEEIETLLEVLRFDERLRNYAISDEDEPKEAALLVGRKRRNQLRLKESCKVAKLTDTDETFSDALKDCKVYVSEGNDQASVQDLQKVLLRMSAKAVANPVATTDFIVAMDSKTARTASVIKKNAWNIVSGQWLLRCLKRKALLPWKQDDMIHKSDAAAFHLFDVPEPAETEEVEEEEEEEATTEDVESILGDVQLDAEDAAAIETEFGVESEEVPGPSVPPLDIETETPTTSLFTDENCEAATSGTIFTDFIFHFHASFPKNKVASYTEKVESQGGTVHEDMDEKATHVVINGVTTDDLDELYDWNQKKKHWLGTFVTAEWIDLSIEEEDRYRVGENPQNLLKK